MKKLLNVLAIVLALNFIVVAGGAAWLWKSGHLDKSRLTQIRALLFPPPAAPATQPSDVVTAPPKPLNPLEALLQKKTGESTSQQVKFIQRSFQTQMLQLDERQRMLADLQRQVDLANQKLASDRDALNKQSADLAQRQAEATKLENDKGFQDSLALYESMPAKQVKSIFMTLKDDTVVEYLQAMQPRNASKIIKEFKSPAEIDFVQRVLEKMRQAQPPATKESGQ